MSERYGDMGNTSERGTVIEGGQRDFSAPAAGVTSGSLEFASGAANVILRVSAEMSDLFRAHFEGVIPELEARDGAVRIRYPQFAPLGWLKYGLQGSRLAADVTLNSAIPWRIAIRGGVARLTGDLSLLRLDAFELGSGATHVELTLPPPVGVVPIRVGGGATHLALHRPVGAAARLRVGGGAAKLTWDTQYLGAIGGQVRLETMGYADAADRYDIEIGGGATHLTVDVR